MLNKVMLIGRLGRDPELKYTQAGTPLTNLNVATDESWTDKNGNKNERTEWHRVVVYDRMAENCSTYLSKGSLVYVEGSLTTRKWQDQQGNDRTTTEVRAQRVQFLDRKGEGRAPVEDGGGQYRQGGQRPPQQARKQQPVRDDDDLGPAFPSEASNMDEVPF